MNEEIYLDIKTYLRLEKHMSEEQRDVYLRDYSRAFKGMTTDWSVPESYAAETYRLERKDKQHKDEVEAANCVLSVDENGNIIIRQGSNVTLIEADQRMAFTGALFSLPSTGGPYQGPGVYGGQSSAPVSNHI